MKDLIIAKRYAKSAIYNIPQESVAVFLKETQSLLEILNTNKDLFDILRSKIVLTSNKLDFLESIIADYQLNEFWHSFFLLLTSKKREDNLIQILSEIINQIHLDNNSKEIDLILAFEHSEEVLKSIISLLERKMGHKIVYHVKIDKDIIGGFIARREDFYMDASVKGNLKQFVQQSFLNKQ